MNHTNLMKYSNIDADVKRFIKPGQINIDDDVKRFLRPGNISGKIKNSLRPKNNYISNNTNVNQPYPIPNPITDNKSFSEGFVNGLDFINSTKQELFVAHDLAIPFSSKKGIFKDITIAPYLFDYIRNSENDSLNILLDSTNNKVNEAEDYYSKKITKYGNHLKDNMYLKNYVESDNLIKKLNKIQNMDLYDFLEYKRNLLGDKIQSLSKDIYSNKTYTLPEVNQKNKLWLFKYEKITKDNLLGDKVDESHKYSHENYIQKKKLDNLFNKYYKIKDTYQSMKGVSEKMDQKNNLGNMNNIDLKQWFIDKNINLFNQVVNTDNFDLYNIKDLRNNIKHNKQFFPLHLDDNTRNKIQKLVGPQNVTDLRKK